MYSLLSKTTQHLARLVNTDKPSFTAKIARVAKQSRENDCGLFAIAYLTHIANGLEPSLFVFDQAKMHQHLAKCFTQKKTKFFRY